MQNIASTVIFPNWEFLWIRVLPLSRRGEIPMAWHDLTDPKDERFPADAEVKTRASARRWRLPPTDPYDLNVKDVRIVVDRAGATIHSLVGN